jgi:hypothetical protein
MGAAKTGHDVMRIDALNTSLPRLSHGSNGAVRNREGLAG